MPTISAFRRVRLRSSASVIALAFPLATPFASPAFAESEPPASILYIDTNATASGGNAVLAYRIAGDGKLHALAGSPFLTQGTGFFDPSYVLGPFDNDENLIVSPDGTALYAVNAGSNTIAGFRIAKDGSLSALPRSPYPAQVHTPISLGIHNNTLIAVDSAENPAEPTGTPPRLSVSEILPDGSLLPVPHASSLLPFGYQPGQALATDTSDVVFTQGFPGGGTIRSYLQLPILPNLLPVANAVPPVIDGTAALPLGLWAHPTAPYLYVGFVNINRIGVYRYGPLGALDYVGSASDSGAAPCWLRTSSDGRFLYASNTGDQSISVYDVTNPAKPTEIEHLHADGVGGYEQFSLDPTGTLLYVLEQENSAAVRGQSNKIHVFSVDRSTGLVAAIDTDTISLPIPAGNRPIGLVIH